MTREEASYILRRFYADGYKSNNYNALEIALKIAVICLENLPHWISVEFPHWISVEDELPPLTHKEEDFGFDYSDKVLVLLKETDADGMMITFAECNRDHPRVIDGDEPKEECYWSAVKSCDMYEGFGDNITHWMPMPQPPKEGGDLSNGKEIEIECDYE